MPHIHKLNLLNLKTTHSNLIHLLDRGAAEGDSCSYVEKLILSVKRQLKYEEEVTEKLSEPFPENHLQAHQKLSNTIDELAANINHYEKSDLVNIVKTLYFAHHYGHDLHHYDNLSSKFA